MPQNPAQISAAVAAVYKERQPGDTPEILLQRVKDRLNQPPADPTPFFLQAREQGGRTMTDMPIVGQEEPSSWIGGFLKSIKDQVVGGVVDNDATKAAAHPSSLGDFLQLIIPSQVPNLPFGAMMTEIKDGVRSAKSKLDIPRSVLSTLSDWATRSPEAARVKSAGRFMPGDYHQEQSFRSARGEALDNQLSGMFDAEPPMRPSAREAARATSISGGTLVKNPQASPSLEEELLGSLMQPEPKPMVAELPPQPTMTPGGNPSTNRRLHTSVEGDRSRLVNPSSANQGGRLAGPAKPAASLEEELLSDLMSKPEPTVVELGPDVQMTPAGKPSVTAEGQEAVEAAAAGSPRTRLVNPSSANRGGRLAGPAQPQKSLEEELLSDLMQGDKPVSTELPPGADITDTDTARQSGRFGKKKAIGQAGRYDSGTPGVTQAQQSAIEDDIASLDAATNPSVKPQTPSTPAASTSAVPEPGRSNPTLDDALAGVEQNPRALPEALDASDWTPDDWQAARDMWGSKNVSAMTGVPLNEVQRLAPNKRGRPLYVEMIMREDAAKNRFEWE